MKRKIICALVCLLLIATTTLVSGVNNLNIEVEKMYISTGSNGYILDQYQPNTDDQVVTIVDNIQVAQAFKPSMTSLAKVRLFVQLEDSTEESLEVSIRNDLSGEDLTYISVSPSRIPSTRTWVNFDFDDIEVEPEHTYYIVVRTASKDASYYWFLITDKDDDRYVRGSGWFSLDSGNTWENWDEVDPYFDFCFKTYSYSGNQPDLDCNGDLTWTEVKPGDTITGSFTVENIGDSDSLLSWKINGFPSWGSWNFSIEEGIDLMPDDGKVTIEVSIVAPDESQKTFIGEIEIINIDNSSDFCTIQVSLATPKNHRSIDLHSFQILQRIIYRSQLLKWILSNHYTL